MLKDIIRVEMNKALKEENYKERAVYSLFLDALEKKEKEKRAPLTEEEEGEVVLKLIKMADESVALIPKEMTWRFEEAEFEKAIYKRFAPVQMNEDSINKIIEECLIHLGINETATIKSKGLLMKTIMPLLKGKADGQLINKLVEARLQD